MLSKKRRFLQWPWTLHVDCRTTGYERSNRLLLLHAVLALVLCIGVIHAALLNQVAFSGQEGSHKIYLDTGILAIDKIKQSQVQSFSVPVSGA